MTTDQSCNLIDLSHDEAVCIIVALKDYAAKLAEAADDEREREQPNEAQAAYLAEQAAAALELAERILDGPRNETA